MGTCHDGYCSDKNGYIYNGKVNANLANNKQLILYMSNY